MQYKIFDYDLKILISIMLSPIFSKLFFKAEILFSVHTPRMIYDSVLDFWQNFYEKIRQNHVTFHLVNFHWLEMERLP